MSSISIQFHALASEMVPLIHDLVASTHCHVVGINYRPFSAVEIPIGRIEESLLGGHYRRYAFTDRELALPVLSAKQFSEEYPGSLIFEVGRLTERGLEQSMFGCRTFDGPVLAAWRRFARKFRSITMAGAVAINPDTKATATARAFRYTAGAKHLNDAGVPMLPIAGGTILMLGKDTGQHNR